jgi:UDP-N-acetylmuramate--alanine ligase
MRIHFIGIGGIGVSALVRYYLAIGAQVSGSDLAASEITQDLAARGVRIVVGKHSAFNIPRDADRVIRTAAVPKTNPELREAHRRKIPVQTYAEALGDLTRHYRTVTVSGSHGKSTTTAMTALVLEDGWCDPTVIIGTKMAEYGNSNFRHGRGGYLVLEADEWNKSFLNYSPFIAVLTNIDAEHLDTYKTVGAVEKAFASYLAKVPADGAMIANADDERTRRVARAFGRRVTWYSRASADGRALAKILHVPGHHNLSNALAAQAAGRALGIPEAAILRALARFRGTWRRFEFKGMFNDGFLFSDYGHHPREIAATLQAARERFPMRRIWCVFQPHQHQRLRYLWDDFLMAFDLADRTCLLPVYDVAGRETAAAKNAVNSEKLAGELSSRGKRVSYAESFDAAAALLRGEVRAGDAIVVMGAGDIYRLADTLAAGS